jgi:hypothetical protein
VFENTLVTKHEPRLNNCRIDKFKIANWANTIFPNLFTIFMTLHKFIKKEKTTLSKSGGGGTSTNFEFLWSSEAYQNSINLYENIDRGRSCFKEFVQVESVNLMMLSISSFGVLRKD